MATDGRRAWQTDYVEQKKEFVREVIWGWFVVRRGRNITWEAIREVDFAGARVYG